jgi:UDP-N-acetylmuramoyl-tripeptide--D-alanyl-D-alanine ligase
VGELVQATGGELVRGDTGARVRSFSIDTRSLERESAFFALEGTHTDGHGFLDRAAERGAVAAVIVREPEEGQAAPPALIRVADVEAALTACGMLARSKVPGAKWIAVTGSNGKTTTKELMAEGLSASFRVHRTPGNYNNHLGVPLTLLACPTDAEVVVVELAMSASGEIAVLAALTKPDVGLVTNVRAAHMRSFATLDDIAAAKGELFALLPDDATAVVNLDDSHVRVQAARHAGPRYTFGQHAEADVRMEELRNCFVPGAAFRFSHEGRSRTVRLRIGGAHAAFDALAALAGVIAVGGDVDGAIEKMQRLEASPGRGKVHRLAGNMLLIDDSYNSSPSALASVLETMRLSEPEGRKVLVMGDMLELGPLETALHQEAGRRAATAGVQLLITIGPLARGADEAARRAGVPEVHHHADSVVAAESVAEFLKPGDLIVVKGSRGVHTERVVQALTKQLEEVH